MTETSALPPAVPVIMHHPTLADLRMALALGWRDFTIAPLFGLFIAGVYVAGGWLIVWAMTAEGQIWWTLPAAAGFPILGPFVACGLYELSRRIEAGQPQDWRGVLGVVFAQRDRQIPSMAAMIVIYFLFWNFLAHMIFALFLGRATLINISSSLQMFATAEGMMFLAIGTALGAVIAALLFALTWSACRCCWTARLTM